MIYKIYKDGEEINRIVSDGPFVVGYCEINGYTYEIEPEVELSEPEEPETETSVWDELDAAYREGVDSV